MNRYVILNAGLRLDHYSRKDVYNQTKLAPKFGVIVSPVPDKLAVFANYQNGFANKNGVDATGKSFVPEASNQFETGIKYSLFKDKLMGSLSYYNIKVENIVIQDVNNPLFNVQGGTQKSKGIELELLSNPAEGWTIMAGYGYNDSKITNATPDTDGRRPQGSVPTNTANLWTNYTFTSTKLKGLGAGVSINYSGESETISLNPDGDLLIPSYTLIGAHLTYDTRQFKLGLKLNNLTNERYWMGWTNMIPQRPR